jgi:hypothetical protein
MYKFSMFELWCKSQNVDHIRWFFQIKTVFILLLPLTNKRSQWLDMFFILHMIFEVAGFNPFVRNIENCQLFIGAYYLIKIFRWLSKCYVILYPGLCVTEDPMSNKTYVDTCCVHSVASLVTEITVEVLQQC